MIFHTVLLYLDPGSGSYLIQAIIAAVLGALFYFKNIWWKVKSFFYKPRKKDPTGNQDAHGDI